MTNLAGRNAENCQSNKLVDQIIYWDQFQNKIRRNLKLNSDDKINFLSIKEYNILAALSEKGSSESKIAVIFAEGDVSYNNPQKGVIDNKKFLKMLEKVKNNDRIKAVVLRVNSGGGSALTSEIIWREIENIKAKGKPVVASFGDYAASGGYYIAAGADAIVAAPNTLTGSIGVFSMLPNFKKLANEKLGITFDTVKTHNLGVSLSSVYPLSETEKKYMTESTDKIYKTFLQRVATGRKMSIDSVHKYAQGRVWTGMRAKEIGLVDEIGFLQDAINLAAKKAKLTDYKVDEYPKIKKDVWQEIFANVAKSQSSDEDEDDINFRMDADARRMYHLYQKYRKVLLSDGVQARMMYEFEF
jgi:protease-4